LKVPYPVNEQKLLFSGAVLENDSTVGAMNIHMVTTIHLIRIKSRDINGEGTSSGTGSSTVGLKPELSAGNDSPTRKLRSSKASEEITTIYLKADDMLSPKYDYEYPNVDTTRFVRGGKEYVRPVGCLRYALNVFGRYEINSWLSDKDHGWPVCFHCNSRKFLPDCAKVGTVYVSPDYQLAFDSADKFDFEGEEYRLFYQSRVKPEGINELNTERGMYWVVSAENIRPYGVCVKKVMDN